MIHGFLIITHFPPRKVLTQVKRMASPTHRFFIHFNKKNKLDECDPDLAELRGIAGVEVVGNRVKVQWGSFGMAGATLVLLQAAVKHKEIQYLHLISSECLHVKSFHYIDDFFQLGNRAEYLQHFPILLTKTEGWGAWRYDRYHLHKYFDQRGTTWKDVALRSLNTFLHKSQTVLKRAGISRKLPPDFPKLYGGSAWWSLTHACCTYILDYIHRYPDFLRRFQYTALADEMFFHTIIMSSPFAERVVNNNVRYFAFRNGPHASAVTMEDANEICKPQIIFARKFTDDSAQLLEYLDAHVYNSSNVGKGA